MFSTSSAVSIKIDEYVGYLTFSNPKKHNALDQEAWLAIPDALQSLTSEGARVIVVAGSGSSFCAGADISEFDAVRKNSETALIYEKANADAFAALSQCSVPTIAKISGFCLGGGFGIAAGCDLRFASQDASFAVPAAKLGLGYPVAAMGDIVAAVGEQGAKRLLFTAQRFDADKMAQMGFLSEVTSKEELDTVVDDIATTIAGLAPLTHRATKAAIEALTTGDTTMANALGGATFSSEDYAEGRAAFKEKRKAVFKGR